MNLEDIVTTIEPENKISSYCHTLYWEDEVDYVDVEIGTPNGSKTARVEYGKHTKFELFIGDFMEDANAAFDLFKRLRDSDDEDTLTIYIDSPGGRIDQGMKFVNTIKSHFKGRTTTILDPNAASMGAILFCYGDVRIASENSEYMIHNYSAGAIGKGNDIMKRVEFEDKRCKKFFHDTLVKPGYLTEDEFRDVTIGDDYYMDAIELALRGIATHITVGEYALDADKYLEYVDSGLDIEDFVELLELAEELDEDDEEYSFEDLIELLEEDVEDE